MKFASKTDIEIAKLCDGESVSFYLPTLTGKETREEILGLLRKHFNKVVDVSRLV